MTPAMLTISDFGRRCGLSHKALRLYDLSGLLPPAHTDPVTGYRFYSPDQFDRARRVSLLRQIGMPLATVAEVLAGSDEHAVTRLDGWWAVQEATMRERRGSLAYLRAKRGADRGLRALHGHIDPAGPVTIWIEPAHTEAICTVTRDDCNYPRIMRAYDAVESWAAGSGRPSQGPPGEIYFAQWCDVDDDEPFAHVAQPVGQVPARVGVRAGSAR